MHKKYPQFLASEIPDLPPEQCLFHIIPAPYEKTVTYGTGTAEGPWAILKASYQLEAFDGVSEPCGEGIYTRPPCETPEEVETAVGEALDAGAMPILLGGEHTVTYHLVKTLKARGLQFGVVQFDAHADLRDQYEGTPWSHACVMKRIYDLEIPIYEIGTRSLSRAEDAFRRERNIPYLDAVDVSGGGLPDWILPPEFPPLIYVTFDVDVLDPCLMPATGTPEPGGLDWYTAMALLEILTIERRILGFDVVELSPITKQHAPDFTAARLIYNFMGFIQRSVNRS